MKRVVIALLLALSLPLTGLLALAEDGQPLRLTRDFSSRYAEEGEWITLSYTLRNTSAHTLGRVTLTDPILGEDQPEQVRNIEPGESRTVTARARVSEDIESAPTARYMYGGVERTAIAAPETVFVETTSLAAELTLEARRTLALTVTNNGTSPVFGVKATDAALGDMGEAVDRLDPGESASWTRVVSAPGARYQCDVSATSASGKRLSARSNELAALDAAAPTGEAEPVTLTAGVDGDGQLFVALFNPGPDMLRNVTLREHEAGVERRIAFVPAGNSAHVTWPRASDEGGMMRFEAVSADGAALAEASIAAPATEAPLSPDATPDPLAALEGPSLRMNEPPQTYRAMLASVLIVLLAVALVWHVAHQWRRRQARKARIRRRQEKKKQQLKKNGEKAA